MARIFNRVLTVCGGKLSVIFFCGRRAKRTYLAAQEGKHISMDTLARICETLDCGITDVIELVSDEPSATGGNDTARIMTAAISCWPGDVLSHNSVSSRILLTSLSSSAARTGRTLCWG